MLAGLKADRRLLTLAELKDGLRDEETEEFRRLDAAEPDRDRGGVSANARMDRSNSEKKEVSLRSPWKRHCHYIKRVTHCQPRHQHDGASKMGSTLASCRKLVDRVLRQ